MSALSSAPPDRARLAARIDHTLLRPGATREQVAEHVAEAGRLGVTGVCVSPGALPVRSTGPVVGTVAGYPDGTHHALIKAMEGRLALDQGAARVELVADPGALAAGRVDEALGELVAARDAVPAPAALGALLWWSALPAGAAGAELLERCCRAAAEAGLDLVTLGVGLPGGESPVPPEDVLRAVAVMAAAVPARVGVKVLGEPADAAAAEALLDAGATRLGTGRTAELL